METRLSWTFKTCKSHFIMIWCSLRGGTPNQNAFGLKITNKSTKNMKKDWYTLGVYGWTLQYNRLQQSLCQWRIRWFLRLVKNWEKNCFNWEWDWVGWWNWWVRKFRHERTFVEGVRDCAGWNEGSVGCHQLAEEGWKLNEIIERVDKKKSWQLV